MSDEEPTGASTPRRYSAHLDTLTALITYPVLTHHKSRTATGLANALGPPVVEVQATFDDCPAMFRCRVGANSEPYYTLHARYALRPFDTEEDEGVPEVRPNILAVLLNFVSEQAREERQAERFVAELASAEASSRRAAVNARLAGIAAAVAAVAAVAGAVISAFVD